MTADLNSRALLRERRGDYGYVAPRQGRLPTGGGGVLFASLAAIHRRGRHARLAIVELAASAFHMAPMACSVP